VVLVVDVLVVLVVEVVSLRPQPKQSVPSPQPAHNRQATSRARSRLMVGFPSPDWLRLLRSEDGF
jgi:hypothetical protein